MGSEIEFCTYASNANNIMTLEYFWHFVGATQDSAAGSKEHSPIPELKDLTCHLNKVSDQWVTLGVQLGLPKSELNNIEVKYQNNSKRCLIEMLEEWLQQQVDPSPSWADVVNAVKSLGDNQLEKELREKYLSWVNYQKCI